MNEVYSNIVKARLEFDPSWNHSRKEQALCSASECAKCYNNCIYVYIYIYIYIDQIEVCVMIA